MIRRYEAQVEPEARFVRAADKCCPALVHASNGARDLAEYGWTAADQDRRRAGHREEVAAYAAEFTALLDLRDVLAARLAAALRARGAGQNRLTASGGTGWRRLPGACAGGWCDRSYFSRRPPAATRRGRIGSSRPARRRGGFRDGGRPGDSEPRRR